MQYTKGIALSALALSALSALASGCAVHATQAQLQGRASRDLGCPHDNLRTRQLDEKTQWVAGCGKNATYREVCKNGRDGESCTWEKQEASADEAKADDDERPAKKKKGKDDEDG